MSAILGRHINLESPYIRSAFDGRNPIFIGNPPTGSQRLTAIIKPAHYRKDINVGTMIEGGFCGTWFSVCSYLSVVNHENIPRSIGAPTSERSRWIGKRTVTFLARRRRIRVFFVYSGGVFLARLIGCKLVRATRIFPRWLELDSLDGTPETCGQ